MGTCEVKARKGLIRVSVTVSQGIITSARITGDFIVVPEDAVLDMEERLVNVRASRDDVSKVVNEAIRGASLIGCSEQDFVDAILCAAGEAA